MYGHKTFAFWPTVWSHGWCELSPFAVNPDAKTLQRIVELPDGGLTKVVMKGIENGVDITLQTEKGLSKEALEYVDNMVRYVLCIDTDLSSLHRFVRTTTEFSWIAREKAGRLLRGPTVFEDLVKTICTTNCTWEQTKRMVQRLCELLGKKGQEDEYSFPRPNSIASSSEEVLRSAGLGYRAKYILDLAISVSEGEVDVEQWAHSSASTGELRRTIESVKGMGPYGSANMLRLLGRTDHLYVDNRMLKTFSTKRNAGNPVTGSDIARYYARFGKWEGLILWLDLS